MTDSLPEYSNPPVAEVALALSFEELLGLSVAHLGEFWSTVQKMYPRVEEHVPLEFQPEQDSVSEALASSKRLPFRLVSSPKIRLWFVSSDGTQLVQTQRDLFALNWRKQTNAEGSYPHYQNVKESFAHELKRFNAFTEGHGLGRIVPKVCELTYTNHVRTSSQGSAHAAIWSLLTVLRPPDSTGFLPPVEDGRINLRYPMIQNDRLLGRLNVVLQPAVVLNTQEPILNLSLIAKSTSDAKTVQQALAFFDMAHEWIVQGFTELTTPEMHAMWGRTR